MSHEHISLKFVEKTIMLKGLYFGFSMNAQ